ncbi:carbamoyltransferase [Myxococcota bacterium]
MRGSDGPTHILGISAFFHDAAAALIRDGEIVAAAQQERFSRIKGDPSFPTDVIRYCLAEGDIDLDGLDYVVFHEKPWIHFERLVETYLAHAPRGWWSFLRAMPPWLGQKFFMRRAIREALGYAGPVLFAEHHESHMAASFYASPFDRAAILTVDGVGEWATTSWGHGEGHRLTPCGELHFPHSLGLLYSAVTAYLGFQVNRGEYKVMGLAPYGEPRYVDTLLDEVVDLRDDGSFRLDMTCFDYPAHLRMTSERFHRLLGGPPRVPETDLDQRHMDVARSLQIVTEEILLRLVGHVHRETDLPHLVLGGGVGLNCVANGRILREGPFEKLWIQPAAGDAGSALGCALAAWHRYLDQPRPSLGNSATSDAVAHEGQPRDDRQRGSYLGPSYDAETIRATLDRLGAVYERINPADVPGLAADLIADGQVLGLLHGRMEFGPRALGARSILADPRRPDMQRTLNLKIKFRESFRPFAPAALADRAGDFFDLDCPSPYMLLVVPVREAHRKPPPQAGDPGTGLDRLNVVRSDIPAVTHIDCSARVQTVDGTHNRRFHDIIAAFAERTGTPVIVNTSFSVRGEPIVCTPEEAVRCFRKTEMDAVLIEDFLLRKSDQPDRPPTDEPASRRADEPASRQPAPTAATAPPSNLGLPVRSAPRLWRNFGLLLAFVAAACSLWGAWRSTCTLDLWRIIVLAAGGALGLVGLALPRALRLPYLAWMAFARLLGRITAPIVLTLLFLLLVLPVGLLRRLFGDPMRRKRAPPGASYWLPREDDGRGPERYTQQF